jgi:hypothetical protein
MEVEIEQSTEILQSIETFQSFGITHGTKWSTCAGTRMLLVFFIIYSIFFLTFMQFWPKFDKIK